MRAMIIAETGLELRDVPMPQPGPDEVLIRVHAAGLNRAELAMAAGQAHGSHGGAGDGIGLEWSGEVAEIGINVTEVKPGDRVMASGNGGYAEYAMTDRGRVSPVPDSNMGWIQAATLPIALQTMHDAIATNGALQAGQAVLIQGASSGVGLMGLQIARELGATTILGASRNPAHRNRLPEFGATGVIDTADEGWPRAVLDATGGEGVDLVIDMCRRWSRGVISRRHASRGASSTSAGSVAKRGRSNSTSMPRAGSPISASRSGPAAPRRCARATVACGRIYGPR